MADVGENFSKLRVLELFSGIGGWHCGLKESGVSFTVVAAADVNTAANEIYKFNFPETTVVNKAIQAISVAEFDKFSADMIVMSPPCQPFTRVGLKKDTEDVRTKPFLHILEVLESMKNLPKYLLLENVKGFEVSEARKMLVETMEKCGYSFQEFLLTPLQFGIPNARLRYYFLAKKNPLPFGFALKNEIWEELPECAKVFMKHRTECDNAEVHHEDVPNYTVEPSNQDQCLTPVGDTGWMGTCENCKLLQSTFTSANNCNRVTDIPGLGDDAQGNSSTSNILREDGVSSRLSDADSSSESELLAHEVVEQELSKYTRHCRSLRHYLEKKDSEYFDEFLVPDEKLKRLAVMDVVKESSRKCICFTKSYAHHMNGTGSMLQQGPDPEGDVDLKKKDFTPLEWEHLRSLRLRYFTPREIAHIMCFPTDYDFPENFTKRRCYRVLGNSLNVHVCATLIKLLVLPEVST